MIAYREAFGRYSMAVEALFSSSPWSEQEVDITKYYEQDQAFPTEISSSARPNLLDECKDSNDPMESLSSNQKGEASSNDLLPAPKMCPLIIGEVDICQPSRCGPDAPCMNFDDLLPIEECTALPCIQTIAAIERSPSLPEAKRRKPRSRFDQDSAISALDFPVSVPFGSPTLSSRSKTFSKRGRKSLLRPEAKQRAKAAHSLVEKKYRENLNSKMISLHDALRQAQSGATKYESSDFSCDEDDTSLINKKPGTTANMGDFKKSDVLSDALAYIDQTQSEKKHMSNEIRRLSDRLKVLEKLVRCQDCSLLKDFVDMHVAPRESRAF